MDSSRKMINNCARENDSNYYIPYLDDWKLTSPLLQVLLNNGFNDVVIVLKEKSHHFRWRESGDICM